MTNLAPAALLGIWTLRLALALVLWVAQGLVIYCLLNIFPGAGGWRRPLSSTDVVPCLAGINSYAPRDPVEKLEQLPAGPHRAAAGQILQCDGLRMPLMVSDASRRDNAVNACLSGRAAERYAVSWST